MDDEKPPLPDIPQEDWDATPPTIRAVIMLLLSRIADLEARLTQHSGNSSKPPSSDPPDAPPKPSRTPRGKPRQRGAQPGHDGQTRDLLPPDQVTEIVAHHPTTCPHCQTDLLPDLPDAAPVQRHQVWDIPPIEPHITEHRMHAVCCPHCQQQVRAENPAVAHAGSGPHVTTLAALLHGRYRLSIRETSEALNDLFGVAMSSGSVVASCARVSDALSPVYDEVQAVLPQQPVANVDETSWRQNNQRHWLWALVTPIATLFHINRSRGGPVWRDVLGETYAGILGSDRLLAYNRHPTARRQLCWAHLQRNLRAIAERRGEVGAWADEMLAWVQMLFAIWQAYRDGAMDRATLELAMETIKDALWGCLLRGADVPWPKARALSSEMMRLWDGWWVFVTVAGVEPTNNAAEQALRPAVLWRKGCFGTQSDAGSRFVERILTVRETCRRQGRHLRAFVTAAVEAHRVGQPAPRLLSTTP